MRGGGGGGGGGVGGGGGGGGVSTERRAPPLDDSTRNVRARMRDEPVTTHARDGRRRRARLCRRH